MYVVRKTRSVHDRNLICFIITYPPATTQLTSSFLAAHFERPRVHLLIVVSLRSATGWCGLIHPPCLNLRPLSYTPPARKFDQTPLKKRSGNAIPRPFQPPPQRSLVDCCVVEVGDQAVRSNSPARSQIVTSILPSTLVDCGVVEVWDWVVRSNSPARLQIATSILPPPG